jgi:hydroxymethylpyrimidine/phosphomethylpyrimidine kinase
MTQGESYTLGSIPIALTIAGSDSSGGAGIQADLKTFEHFKVYGHSAITCVVAEIPGKVLSIQPIDSAIVREQIQLSLENFPVTAIKTGMLFSAEIVNCVCEIIEHIPNLPPLVVDPVKVASAGVPLQKEGAIYFYRNRLFPLASLITPNLDEAGALLGQQIKTFDEMKKAAATLFDQFKIPFLIKGGHLSGDEALDLFIDQDGYQIFSASYQKGIVTHGTGCTYSAAIAANLALGTPMVESIRIAKKFISKALLHSHTWPNGLSALNTGVQVQEESAS